MPRLLPTLLRSIHKYCDPSHWRPILAWWHPREMLARSVADAAADVAVFVAAGELGAVGGRRRVRRAVVFALHGDGQHADIRRRGQLRLDGILLRLALH